MRTRFKSSSVSFSDLTENQKEYTDLKDFLGIEFIDMKIDEILQTEFRTNFVDKNKDFKFEEFYWGKNTETQASPQAMQWLNNTLNRIKVYNGTKTRNLFDKTGFKFVDARKQNNKIGFSLDGTSYHGK